MLRLKVALTTGIVLACPVWLYQIWAFIVPALHRNEKRYTAAFVALGGTLFVSGAVLGYFMITSAFSFCTAGTGYRPTPDPPRAGPPPVVTPGAGSEA